MYLSKFYCLIVLLYFLLKTYISGGIFDKLIPLVILTSNLRGALSFDNQEHRKEHLIAIQENVDHLGADIVQSKKVRRNSSGK